MQVKHRECVHNVPLKELLYFRLMSRNSRSIFYSAAALLAMQSAVIATAILSVCPSVSLSSHAGIVPRRMKIGAFGLSEVAKTL